MDDFILSYYNEAKPSQADLDLKKKVLAELNGNGVQL